MDNLQHGGYPELAKVIGGDMKNVTEEQVAEAIRKGLWLQEIPTETETETLEATISLKGKRICITGKLDKTRKELEELIEQAGGVVVSGVKA